MLQLKTVCRTQPHTVALKSGAIGSEQLAMDFTEVPVLVNAFRRMVRATEFDVCEMAFTTYLCAKEHGKPFTALPIFLVRGFHHGAILRPADSGLRSPKDLEGRAVGVERGYTVTTGVWARGILEEEHGVDLDKVTWLPSGDEHVEEYTAPPNVRPLRDDRDFEALLASGELAAVVGANQAATGMAPVIDDPVTAGRTALVDRGFYPINHLVVVRDELLEEHPGLGQELFELFERAKDAYVGGLRVSGSEQLDPTDRMYRDVMQAQGSDPLPYGVGPNREMIDKLIGYALRQHIIAKRPDIDAIFATYGR